MANKVLSIEIGYTSTKICLVDYKIKSPKVYKYVKLPTPMGVVQDGLLNATEEFAAELKASIAMNKMNCKNVVFTVNSTKIASREVTVPMVKDNRLMDMIKANSSDYFPIDLTQYQLGCIKLGLSQEGNGDRLRVMVLAIPNFLIDSYSKLAEMCGLNLLALDYSGNSVYQVVKENCKKGIQMVIKIDDNSSVLTIMKEQVMVLQRSIAYGVGDAIEAIVENEVFGCESYQEAAELATRKTCTKLAINAEFLIEEDEEEVDTVELATAKQNVANSFNMLVGAISRVIDFYTSRNGGEQIDQIYITGAGSSFSGLSKLMTNEIGLKIKNLRHVENMSLEKFFTEGQFGEYIGCIGAVIAPVVLVEENAKKKKQDKAKADSKDYTGAAYLLLIGGTLLAIALLGVSFMNYTSENKEYDQNVATLNSLTEIKTIYAKYLGTKAAHVDVANLYAITENSNEELVSFIEEMEEKMPADIQVTNFVSDKETVNMSIEVGTKEEMANAVQQLRSFHSLSDVKVLGSQDEISELGVRTVTFTVSGIYKTRAELEAEEAAAAQEAETAE